MGVWERGLGLFAGMGFIVCVEQVTSFSRVARGMGEGVGLFAGMGFRNEGRVNGTELQPP